MKRKKVSQELINISKLTLNKIDQNENFGKYPNWLNINLSTGLIFDSNVPSAFSSSEDTTGDFPGIPTVEGVDSSVSSIGGRFENYISIFLYPLNLNKHSIILNLNNFLALHYPSIIDDVFDPQTYDIVNVSSFIAYEFHNYFTEKNVLKLFVYSGYDATWSNPINDLNLYSTSIQTGFNIYYKFENTIDIGLYNSLNFDTYETDEEDFSQTGKYFSSIFLTIVIARCNLSSHSCSSMWK